MKNKHQTSIIRHQISNRGIERGSQRMIAHRYTRRPAAEHVTKLQNRPCVCRKTAPSQANASPCMICEIKSRPWSHKATTLKRTLAICFHTLNRAFCTFYGATHADRQLCDITALPRPAVHTNMCIRSVMCGRGCLSNIFEGVQIPPNTAAHDHPWYRLLRLCLAHASQMFVPQLCEGGSYPF